MSSTHSQAAGGAVRPGRGAGDGLTGGRPSAAPGRPGLRAGSGGVPPTGADPARTTVLSLPDTDSYAAGVPRTGAAGSRLLGGRAADDLTRRSHHRPAPRRAARPAGSVSPA